MQPFTHTALADRDEYVEDGRTPLGRYSLPQGEVSYAIGDGGLSTSAWFEDGPRAHVALGPSGRSEGGGGLGPDPVELTVDGRAGTLHQPGYSLVSRRRRAVHVELEGRRWRFQLVRRGDEALLRDDGTTVAVRHLGWFRRGGQIDPGADPTEALLFVLVASCGLHHEIRSGL